MKLNFPKLIFSILLCQLAGLVGSLFTFSSIPIWYASLNKPFFTPPNWLFAPAWITLYALMGIAAYLVWEKGPEKKEVRFALSLFALQLILNSLWSIIFFGFRLLLPAFIEIILLWLAILATTLKFKSISKNSALLMLPYLLWVAFAAALNFAVLMLNP